MNHAGKILTMAMLVLAGAAMLALPQFAGTEDPGTQSAGEPVPAFHAQPPQGELPPTMAPSIYTDKLIFNAYAVAGRVKKVLYQEPCYCHCDRSSGHGSLLDCFTSRHGAGCDICQKEAFYAYEQTKKGKNPTQIREAIERGDWQKLDLAKYSKDYLPPR